MNIHIDMNIGLDTSVPDVPNAALAYSPSRTSSPPALRKRLRGYTERLRALNILGARLGNDASRWHVETKLDVSRELLSVLAALLRGSTKHEELLRSTVDASRDHIATLKALVRLTPFDDERSDLRADIRAAVEQREHAQMILDDIVKIQRRTAQNVTRSRLDIDIATASRW